MNSPGFCEATENKKAIETIIFTCIITSGTNQEQHILRKKLIGISKEVLQVFIFVH